VTQQRPHHHPAAQCREAGVSGARAAAAPPQVDAKPLQWKQLSCH
jgi:hypothetical protein